MPSFDALAGASLTPGGVANGFSDLVRSLVEAPIQRRQIEMQRQQMMNQQGLQQQEMGLKTRGADLQEKEFGHTVERDTANETEQHRHNTADEANSRAAIMAKRGAMLSPATLDAEAAKRAEMETGVSPRGTKRQVVNKAIPDAANVATNPFAVKEIPGGAIDAPASPEDMARFQASFLKHRKNVEAETRANMAGSLTPGLDDTPEGAGAGPASDADAGPGDQSDAAGASDLTPQAMPAAPAAPVAPRGPAAPAQPSAMAAIVQKLPPGDQAAYARILQSGDATKIQAANRRLMGLR